MNAKKPCDETGRCSESCYYYSRENGCALNRDLWYEVPRYKNGKKRYDDED